MTAGNVSWSSAIVVLLTALAPSALAAETQSAPLYGEYEGVYTAMGREPLAARADVISEGPGLYRATLAFTSAGPEPANLQIEIHGHTEDQRVVFSSYSNSAEWLGTLQGGKLHIERRQQNYGSAFDLDRFERHSPTEGMAPPAGAVVLLPYKEGVAPDLSAWTNAEWEALPDGSMRVKPRSGQNMTKEAFGDCELHLEFATAHQPTQQGQDRSNSGVYFQSRYEVQVLDSYGVLSGSGDCGGIYETAAPRVNASYPPEQWQTYDVTFRAPRLNADGTIKEPALLTVKHNGVLIHENQPVDHVTRGGVEGPFVDRDVIMLQDHGNPVRYRNMWVVPAGK